MISGRNNTIKWLSALTEQNFPYWTIYHRGKTDSGHHVFKSSQADDLTMPDSLNDLRNKLDILGYGQYTIIAQSKTGNVGKGSAKEDFEITTAELQQSPAIGSAAPVVNMAGYVTKEEATQMATEMFNQLMLKKKVEDLEKQNAELVKEKKLLEKENESGTNRIINMIAGIVEPMMKPPVQQYAQVGTVGTLGIGVNQDATKDEENSSEGPTAEQKELGNRLQKVLEECEQLFGEPAIPFLEKLMHKVREQPYLVSMVKSALG